MPATIAVLDGTGASQTVNTLPALGQVAKSASLPVALASDDVSVAALGIVTETAPASDTASSGLNGRLQRIAQRLTSLIAQVPAALGQTTKGGSLSVTVASDQGALSVLHTPATSTARLLSSAASDNATSATAVATTVYGMQGYNARSTAIYLKTYDKASAPSSSDTPRKTLYIPAGAAFTIDYPNGNKYALGFGYRITTGGADNDTGAVASGDLLGFNVDYI